MGGQLFNPPGCANAYAAAGERETRRQLELQQKRMHLGENGLARGHIYISACWPYSLTFHSAATTPTPPPRQHLYRHNNISTATTTSLPPQQQLHRHGSNTRSSSIFHWLVLRGRHLPCPRYSNTVSTLFALTPPPTTTRPSPISPPQPLPEPSNSAHPAQQPVHPSRNHINSPGKRLSWLQALRCLRRHRCGPIRTPHSLQCRRRMLFNSKPLITARTLGAHAMRLVGLLTRLNQQLELHFPLHLHLVELKY
ncbi:hypothetical protein PTTG_03730 [Puccinia triticina 1-1 BBBD Race 1]|uniref:Uncharacterized protein n=1 Tax=Puccinia triticina (isolate 1-1 / race 1 (BBBD)) TaxID=630390 RepID=A0A180GGJ5_PUCT1|nr:hypothetical protein PTTG_03730 [Puccinia triticina 1-1 BBBD Race 1]